MNPRLLLIIFPALFIFSCKSSQRINKDFLLFQRGTVYSKSLNQEQAMLFNLPNTGGSTSSNSQALQNSIGYLVDMNGNIEVPLIGEVKAAGLTRAQLTSNLLEKIARYVKDPGVMVRYLQFKVNVLGEVRSPGTKSFQTDRVTLIDAISAAGDLTDNGKREDVLVVREENGTRKSYTVDLRSGAAYQSPVFQLQQNDLVYVGANVNKLKAVNTNPNVQRDIQIGLAIASFAALIFNIINIVK
jgi:polysaccharide biosynthesis/export protein